MDPQETLRLILEETADGNIEEAMELIGYLADWIGKGGFAPTLDAQYLKKLPDDVRHSLWDLIKITGQERQHGSDREDTTRLQDT